jgi:hypothetical protein
MNTIEIKDRIKKNTYKKYLRLKTNFGIKTKIFK